MAQPEASILPKDPLTNRPIPDLLSSQLDKFTRENLGSHAARQFNPAAVRDRLLQLEGQEVTGIDLGGDKIIALKYKVRDGLIMPSGHKSLSLRSSHGKGYLHFLEAIAEHAQIPIGVSFAGPIEGTRPIKGPNVERFVEELRAKYKGDVAHIFPAQVTCENDSVAGLIAGSIEATRQSLPQKVLYIINGSGLGGSVLSDNEITAIEPGHVELLAKLNPFGQNTPCNVNPQYECIESVAASRAGIEDLWLKKTGKQSSGEKISHLYIEGSQIASDLYDSSALVTAHAVMGVARTFDLLSDPADTTIVYHGGTFKVPSYADRLQQILAKDLGFTPSHLLTYDFSDNACAQGAAIAALMTV